MKHHADYSNPSTPSSIQSPPSLFHQAISALRIGGPERLERLTDTLHKSSVIYTIVFGLLVVIFVWFKGGSPASLYAYLKSAFNQFGLLSTKRSSISSGGSSAAEEGRRKRRRKMSVAATGTKTQKVRKVVLIDHHGARIDSVAANYKPPNGQTIKRLINAEEATRVLKEGSTSVLAPKGSGIWKVEQSLLASNDPMEDKCAHAFYELPPRSKEDDDREWWSFFGIYDGHYGDETSSYLQKSLIPSIYSSLKNQRASSKTPPTSSDIDSTVRKTFSLVDQQILSQPQSPLRHSDQHTSPINKPALHGSCALLAFHNSKSNIIRVALTGDSRAVLGRRVGTSRWLAKVLSVDQSLASNTAEEKRVRSEHPNEPILENNRIMGDLAVSRAFGDARFKWDAKRFAALAGSSIEQPSLRPEFKTPPYVTADPVMTSAEIVRGRGDFLILGSDGLWDFLTNEDAVAIVGRWLDDHQQPQQNSDPDNTTKRVRTKLTTDQEENFVFVDDNAGVHLIRNALGGAREGRVRFSLTVPPGKDHSKRYRDDLTAMVVLFE